MSTNDDTPSSKNNEDILKSLRQLNSCITLTSVKDSNADPQSPSSSSEGSSDGVPDLPTLRGITIQGNKTGSDLLNNLLGKKNEPEQEKKKDESQQTSWLNEWSKRCLSISFANKNAPADEDEEPDEGVGGRGLENGTPSSSSNNNSASNSQDSFPGRKKPPATTSSISIRPISEAHKSISVSVSAAKSKDNSRPPKEQQQQQLRENLKRKREEEDEEEEEEEQEEEEPKQDRREEPKSKLLKSDQREISAQNKQQQQSLQRATAPSSEENSSEFKCSFCTETFSLHSDLISHIPNCGQLGCSVSFPAQKEPARQPSNATRSPLSTPIRSPGYARKKTVKSQAKLPCVRCKINFRSRTAFISHHIQHASNSLARVAVPRCSAKYLKNFDLDDTEDAYSRPSSTESGSGLTKASNLEDKGLKLTFKISSVGKRGRGRKRKTKVQIVSTPEMSEESEERTAEPEQFDDNAQGEEGGQSTSQQRDGEQPESSDGNFEAGTDGQDGRTSASSAEHSMGESSGTSPFEGFTPDQLNFGAAASNERPPSTYQPQFESFPGDWFNEYESGSRIAAAMTGGTSEGGEHVETQPHYGVNGRPGSDSGYSTEDMRNNQASPYSSNDSSDVNKDLPVSSSNEADGLFSQAVLGGEQPRGNTDNGQGSFEQLCLNDSFGQNQQDGSMSQSSVDQSYQHSQPYQQQNQGSGDILSELAYLDNSNQHPMDPLATAPMEGESGFGSHGSNSGTPTSTGHPTPPPTDTSFRALATSPLRSPTSPMNSGGPTPPIQSGATPPIPNSTSPLQQMSQLGQVHLGQQMVQQMGSQPQDAVPAPRLTIANNLMATNANNGMGAMGNAYGQQWASGSNSQQGFPAGYMPSPSMTGTMGSAMGNQIRPQTNLPMGYRPSPPPRIRGRPPLMGHVGRPPVMRGPGRPPGSGNLPPLMAAPGSTRGGMMPSLQRLPQYAGPRAPLIMNNQKRPGQPTNMSPNKSLRREDINVPSRQKDNECQIIAVANRADGLPVISNVQGRDERGANRAAPATTSESTIHLSDSITLSVRSNSGGRDKAGGGEKSGDAGVVANLLASRGITVAPAAGEKDGGGNGSREERRLPTASDLNLSSAISVHPPTSRDRDGFAVPHPPSAKSSSSSSGGGPVSREVERPPRPPTVDLTQEVPTGGALSTRLQCHQCDRTFPTQALLSDHSKVHQSQTQSRMPFKCHLCTAGFSSQKSQQHHYQQFHQLHLSAGDLAIPVVDFRNPVNVQRMARLGIRSFLPLSNLQNRGAGGVVGIPLLTLENLQAGQMNLQQWGITDVLSLGPPRTMNVPR